MSFATARSLGVTSGSTGRCLRLWAGSRCRSGRRESASCRCQLLDACRSGMHWSGWCVRGVLRLSCGAASGGRCSRPPPRCAASRVVRAAAAASRPGPAAPGSAWATGDGPGRRRAAAAGTGGPDAPLSADARGAAGPTGPAASRMARRVHATRADWLATRIFSAVMGKSWMRTPTASSTALAMAGATGEMGFSPMALP